MASKVWLEATLKNGHIKFIDYISFQQITPLPTQRRASSSSNLYWAIWGKDNNKIPVALKTWKSNCDNIDHDAIERFVDELTLLSKVNFHANIVRFFGMSQPPSNDVYFLVMQYTNGGTIRQYLQRNLHQLTWNNKIKMIKEIATGLQCIHNEGMAHRNLHPNNVLVHDGRMMIADLGFSDSWHGKPYHDEMIPFLEPLFLQNNSYQRDKRSDIYSLGVLMCEISSGRPPFESTASNCHLLLRIIMNGERESTVVPGAPLQYVQLYRHCWDGDPISRPTIKEVLHRLDKMKLDSSSVKSVEVRFKLEPISSKSNDEIISNNSNNYGSKRLIKRHSQPNMSPTLSSRVVPNVLNFTNSTNDMGDYVVIDKEELAEYINLHSKHRSLDSSFPKKNHARTRSFSFEKFKSSRTSRSSHEESSLYKQQEEVDDFDEITFENLSVNDVQQPQIILTARYAPKKKIIAAFEMLKRRGENLKGRDLRMKTAIHRLIWNNDLFDMNLGLSSTKCPRHNYFRVALRWLCSNNVSINSKDEFGWTPLHEAIWKRREPGVILGLLDNNADPNITDNYGSTSLHQCLNLLRTTTVDSEKVKLYSCIKLLLSRGANPNLSLPDFILTLSGAPFPNSLFAAVYLDLPIDIIELMVKKGGDINSTSFRGLFLLDFAAKVNNINALKYLTDNKNSFGKKNLFNTLKYSTRSYKYEKSFNRRRFNTST